MTADPADSSRPAGGRGSFPTTQWSMVLQAGADTSSLAQSALQSLCQHYWYPLYSFVRRQGRAHHEAEDCTQEFLARLLAAEGLGRARPEQGRFRTFLLASMCNFLTTEWHRTQAAKRGGGQVPLSLEFAHAQEHFINEPVDPALTPEQAFDRSWALGMLDRALAELGAEYRRSGRGPLFENLSTLVWGNASVETLAKHAARTGLSVEAFHVALHRLRRRVGERLRAAVAETVANGADVEIELRHLISSVSRAPGLPGP